MQWIIAKLNIVGKSIHRENYDVKKDSLIWRSRVKSTTGGTKHELTITLEHHRRGYFMILKTSPSR